MVDQISEAINEYQMGNYSPILMNEDDLPPEAYVVDADEDTRDLETKRKQVMGIANPDLEEEFEKNAIEKLGMSNEDEFIDESSKANKSNTQEISLEPQHYSWTDKYRPRKPRYFNRVHTGYDWNQYNKKHYDVDNPPPKTVQGYKLNVTKKIFFIIVKIFILFVNFRYFIRI